MRVGLLGWGIGSLHGRCYKAMPDVEVVAVADAVPERLEKAVELLGAKGYSSADELLEKEELDLVDVCLPTFMHAEYAIKAMERGCNVLCEKPMALNEEECTAMIEAEKRTGKTLMIAHCVRFWPEYHYLKQVYENGTFGKLQMLSLSRVGSKTITSWKNWMLDPELSGSQTVDRHIHDTDFIVYMLGVPTKLRSMGYVDEAGLSHVSTQFVYPDGPAVVAEGGGNIPPGPRFVASYRAVFEKATLEYSMANDPTLTVYPWDGDPYQPEYEVQFEEEASMEETGANLSSLGAYYNEIRYYVDCLKAGRKPTVVTPEQARETIKVVRAEVESGTKRVEVDL